MKTRTAWYSEPNLVTNLQLKRAFARAQIHAVGFASVGDLLIALSESGTSSLPNPDIVVIELLTWSGISSTEELPDTNTDPEDPIISERPELTEQEIRELQRKVERRIALISGAVQFLGTLPIIFMCNAPVIEARGLQEQQRLLIKPFTGAELHRAMQEILRVG